MGERARVLLSSQSAVMALFLVVAAEAEMDRGEADMALAPFRESGEVRTLGDVLAQYG
jgi:pantoate kinase